MNKVLFYFLIFIIYAFLGWLIETIRVSIKSKKFVDRGFLLGPIIPIYGISSVIMILYLNGYRDNPLTVFLLAMIVCSFIEYITSYIFEKIFDARWWDYSNRKFNINGRVCLYNVFWFGILSLLLIYLINPFIENFVLNLNIKFFNIISITLLIIFLIDTFISFYATFKLKNDIMKLQKDITDELKEKIKERIENTLLNKRLFNAFPKYKHNMFEKYYKKNKNKLLEKVEEIKEVIKSKTNF